MPKKVRGKKNIEKEKKKKEKRSSDVVSRRHLPITKGKRRGLNHTGLGKGGKRGEKKMENGIYLNRKFYQELQLVNLCLKMGD